MTAHEFIDKTGASDDEFQTRIAPFRDELDEFLDELVDRVDECAGTHFRGDSGTGIWFHTPQQITAWVREAQEAWHSGEYTAYRDEEGDVAS